MDVIIIGAGASGLLAAYEAAEKCNVYVIELKEFVGKKILATGNGKCNLTNKNMKADCYNDEAKEFVEKILTDYSYNDIYRYFSELSILLDDEKDYVYPYSKQAKTIVNELYAKCLERNVKFIFNSNVKNILKENNKFTVSYIKTENKISEKKEINADRVVVACGGKASPKLGSDGSGYYLMKKLGHSVTECVPALVPLICDKAEKKYLDILKGVRTKARIFTNYGETSVGELQLTDYGISGIVIFQISAKINKRLLNQDSVDVFIDFMPDFDISDIADFIKKASNNTDTALLSGMLNDKIAETIIAYCKENSIDLRNYERVAEVIKTFKLSIVSNMGYDNAQVTSGGISLEEVSDNMESKIIPSLYITGELLNVDGICGGYNLHFAFASGIIAGKNIVKTM